MLLKKAYSGISPKIWLLALVMLINRAGTMVIAFLSIYATQKLQFSVEYAGYVMMCFGFGSIVGAYVGGKLTDVFGFFVVQFLSLFIGGLIFFWIAEISNFPMLCFGIFVLAVFGESYRPANTASISHFSTAESRTRSYSLVRLAINLGWAMGPVLGGYFATRNYKYLFWVDGISNIMAAILVLYFLKSKYVPRIKLSKEDKLQNKKESAFRDGHFMLFMLFTTLYAIIFYPLFTVLPIYYKSSLHFSEQHIGILMGINGLLVAGLEMLIIYKVENKFSKLQFICLGAFLVVINYMIFTGFISFGWMIVGIVFATLSEIFAMPFMNSFSVERAKTHNTGQYSAVYAMSWSVAQIVSPVLGTQVISKFGYQSLWLLFGAIGVVATTGFYFMSKHKTMSD
jgi:predicted MFS family arabinose efflux permease